MEVYERIRFLRKDTLKMSQTAFGERLGVNRDVINNIENNRLSKPDQKLSLYKLICSEFNISEEWLLNGTGDMYASNEAEYSALIDRVMTGQIDHHCADGQIFTDMLLRKTDAFQFHFIFLHFFLRL